MEQSRAYVEIVDRHKNRPDIIIDLVGDSSDERAAEHRRVIALARRKVKELWVGIVTLQHVYGAIMSTDFVDGHEWFGVDRDLKVL